MKRSSVYASVHNDARKSDCSFGASGGFDLDVLVGWGSADSHKLARIEVTEVYDITQHAKVFCLFVDGHMIKRATHQSGECDVESAKFTGGD